MKHFVPRTCTELPAEDARTASRPRGLSPAGVPPAPVPAEVAPANAARSRPLDEFRERSAYVLLGDPGSGKTTAFQREREALGAGAVFVFARDFPTLATADPPEWHGKTLFIDGLDESRAGALDARTPLDEIRAQLYRLGRPRFRLSCRAADWLGATDRSRLAAVAPDGRLTVLRLDPLVDSAIRELLVAHPRVADSDAFIREAELRGVEGFLANPLNLDMLVSVVAGVADHHRHDAHHARREDLQGGVVAGAADWPASRSELFERACRQMASEQNEEHVIATEALSVESPSIQEVLDAAGRLCAIQLLASVAGYARNRKQADDDHPCFDACGQEWSACPDGANQRKWLRAALATRLFSGGANGWFDPVHRHVAEFLGARYLAGLIRRPKPGCDLPVRRVLALVSGADGSIVTRLRGLSAWLAAHSPRARSDLVERDPVGVGLYGDVGEFSDDEKHALLTLLRGQSESFLLQASSWAAAFAPLATRAMEPALRQTLAAASEREHRVFTHFVLRILTHGSRLPGLASKLFAMVRDGSLSPELNVAALDAFIHNSPRRPERTMALKDLLADVSARRLADPHDELLGTLLGVFYPGALSPSDLWKYPIPPANEMHFRRYWRFWTRALGESCVPAHVADHLDGLARSDDAARALQAFVRRDLAVNLLARGLDLHGDVVETGRLYDWLGVGLEPWRRNPKPGAWLQRVRSWLEQRPEIQKAILAEGLRRGQSDLLWGGAEAVLQRLHGSRWPADFGLWCLERAELAAARAELAADRRVAEVLLKLAFDSVEHRRGDRGLTLDLLIARAGGHRKLGKAFTKLSACRLGDDELVHQERHRRALREEEERETWIAFVRQHEDALRANQGNPQLLHQIAGVYFGYRSEVEGNDPLERLGDLYRGDDRLVDASLAALRGAIHRDDMPGVDGIIDLWRESEPQYLSLPFRAGLAELDRTGEDVWQHLDANRLRIALALQYSDGLHDEPAWYERVVEADPELVAEVLMRCATAELRSRRAHVGGLATLARSENHAPVARLASLRILRSFPIRCTTGQLDDLDRLLWAALQHADRESFGKLIDRKLSAKSMNVGQRVRWLAAAFVLAPEDGAEGLVEFTASDERRARELAAFLGEWWWDGAPAWFDRSDRLGPTGLRDLVRLLGASFAPSVPPPDQVYEVTPAREASRHVDEMIQRLGELPDAAAGAALEALAVEPSLRNWSPVLEEARDRQRVVQRDAAYRPPGIGEVCRTLADGPPANVGDLAALVVDRLHEIGIGIGKGNDNGWRPYWNEGPHRRPVEPKLEDSCRDALLRDLRTRLPESVDAQPEGRYANDTRADIRVACGDFHVPVEIKRHWYRDGGRDLWSALRDQLIEGYASDPATGGYGIYLVFWFGEGKAKRLVPPPPSGPRPHDPGALEARLNQQLTPDERRRITVLVMDVSTASDA